MGSDQFRERLVSVFKDARQKWSNAVSALRQAREELASRRELITEDAEQRTMARFGFPGIVLPPRSVVEGHIAAEQQLASQVEQQTEELKGLESAVGSAMADLLSRFPDALDG